MNYFKINDIEFSQYVNSLKIKKSAVYNTQTNAAGNSVVDLINKKRQIEVGIIPLSAESMVELQNAIAGFNVSITFLNPDTGNLETANCIIPDDEVEYYAIRVDKVLTKAFTLTFIEL